jgi:hypothetical protein
MPGAFDAEGEWLKCALHAHTTNSDGELAPDLLVRHYEWAGFDVLAITDHWVRTVADSTERLLVIPGTELNAQASGPQHDAHVLGIGIAADPEMPTDCFAPLEETVAWILDHGGVPYLAHTHWSGLRADQFEGCEGLVGIEVYNAGCELEIGRGDAALHWDEALDRGRRLYALATDDSHHPGYDSGHAWVWARCAERTQQAVLDALREGCFYSSSGPVIHSLESDGESVTVGCSPVASATLLAGPRFGSRANAGRLGYPHGAEILECDSGGGLTAIRLERPRYSPYLRLELADAAGRKAWTNPFWP